MEIIAARLHRDNVESEMREHFLSLARSCHLTVIIWPIDKRFDNFDRHLIIRSSPLMFR